MKTYQKHDVTVKGTAIAITAELVLDIFKVFQIVDLRIDMMTCRNAVTFERDANNGIKPICQSLVREDLDTVKEWTLLYSLLKTIDSDFESDVVVSFLEAEHMKEKRVKEEPCE